MPDQEIKINEPGASAAEAVMDNLAPAKVLSEKDIVVHTMPKRYLGLRPAVKKARGIGIIVLVCGLLVLGAALGFLYFYLARSGNEPLVVTPVEPVTTAGKNAVVPTVEKTVKTDSPEEKTAAADDSVSSSSAPETNEDFLATTSEDEDITDNNFATSSESVATSTPKIIEVSATTTQETISLKTAVDSDGDGLTDAEEVLFDCNYNSRE